MIGLCAAFTVVLAALNLMGIVTISWVWIFVPLAFVIFAPIVFALVVTMFMFIIAILATMIGR